MGPRPFSVHCQGGRNRQGARGIKAQPSRSWASPAGLRRRSPAPSVSTLRPWRASVAAAEASAAQRELNASRRNRRTTKPRTQQHNPSGGWVGGDQDGITIAETSLGGPAMTRSAHDSLPLSQNYVSFRSPASPLAGPRPGGMGKNNSMSKDHLQGRHSKDR